MDINITFKSLRVDELHSEDLELYEYAKKAHADAYAPYSTFKVGAALRLSSGKIVIGNNQENAAYPSGLCAERVAIFSAMANHPDESVLEMAIYAETDVQPVTPCGSCRQVLVEYEFRQEKPIRIVMANAENVLIAENAISLLPIAFTQQKLKN